MKVLNIVTIFLVTFIVFSEGKRRDRDYKLEKKSLVHLDVKTHHPHHPHHGSKLRGSHLNMKEGGIKSMYDEKWMKPPKNTECKLKCGHKEICISHPKTSEEKCVNKRNFRESRRLFRNFHRDKMILKKDRKKDFLDKELARAEHMQEVYDLIHDYNKKHGDEKKVHIKSVTDKKNVEKIPVEVVQNTAQECRPTELYELKKRMVGWFVLLHQESRREHHKKNHKKHGKKHHKKHHFDFLDHEDSFDMKEHSKSKLRSKRAATDAVSTASYKQCKCSMSVKWEFKKQDSDRNQILDKKELEVMSANKREPCMNSLFKSCDTDDDGAVTFGEWCCCMAFTIPPCLEKKRLTDPKDWVPRCDKEGYYEREQCHDNSGYCWCVDINGNEIVGTKKLGGGHCGQYDPSGHKDVKKL